MGLTHSSSTKQGLKDLFNVEKSKEEDYVIALAGNPNTGKSTVFNSLTGLHQHTGNWPGKTVVNSQGKYDHKGKDFIIVDLPGTYSLLASSVEEIVARDFICFGKPDVTVVVLDATCIERNLNLLLQVLEITDKVVACVNLMDEAKSKNIKIDIDTLSKELGIPVVPTTARSNIGMDVLKDTIYDLCTGKINTCPVQVQYPKDITEELLTLAPMLSSIFMDKINAKWLALRLLDGDESLLNSISKFLDYDLERKNNENIRDTIVASIYKTAEDITSKSVEKDSERLLSQKKFDDIITSKRTGIPIMLLMLAVIFWLTIQGANYPSQALAKFLFWIESKLSLFFIYINVPLWLNNLLVLGVYRTFAWVVSVMLPPMAIFFPIFTLLEDGGYLPRICFNLDHAFKKACCHGKQALTMCMGFGCNAAGVIACRIIESPRERLIAILTNNFVPCNGRFPTLIALSMVFVGVNFSSGSSSIIAALMVVGLVLIGIAITLLTSYALSKTILKGMPSSFTLELPPYRKPQLGRVLYTSLIDRTMFVLVRAITVAVPAGVITYILSNIMIQDMSILAHAANFINPFANIIGLDGFIIIAFILGFPANEIVLPILLMAYLSKGSMLQFESIDQLREILLRNGWTYLTLINTMLFSLLHFPCATTVWTIKKETGSIKWTILSVLMPTAIAIVICFCTTQVYRLFF